MKRQTPDALPSPSSVAALLGALTPLLTSVCVAQGVVQYESSAFDSGAWTIADVGSTPVAGATATYEARNGDGNPGDYARTVIQMPSNPVCPIGSYAALTNSDAVYDPAVSGAIDFIDFQWDIRLSPDEPVTTVGSLALEQDGFVFGAFDVRQSSGAGMPAWRSFDTPGLVASDFTPYSGWSQPGRPDNPDFSENGAQITFGYLIGTSRGFGGPDPLCANPPPAGSDLDNWRVEVTTLPLNAAGQFVFESDSYDVVEADTDVEITVLRTRGTSGAASVDYMTIAETATDGADFVSAQATLDFPDGVTEQSYTVSILDDQEAEVEEAFRIELMNPTGGATVGLPQTTTVTISDDDSGSDSALTLEAVAVYTDLGARVQTDVDIVFTASNSGPGAATGMISTLFPLPPGDYEYVSDDSGGTFTENALGQWVWSLGDLAPGESKTMTARFSRIEDEGAELSLTAELSAGVAQAEPDQNPDNNRASVTVTLGGADVGITITGGTLRGSGAGGSIFFDAVYDIDVTYVAPAREAATDVVIMISTPGSVLEVTPEIEGCMVMESTRGLECRYDELTEGFSTRLQVSVTGGTTGTATATVELSNFDPDTDNNTAEESVDVPEGTPFIQELPEDEDLRLSNAFMRASGWCFIATAGYGSPWEPNVVTLRRFRDEWLLTNAPGRAFVDFYYRTSPPIADWIADRDWARWLVRAVLTPVVFAIRHPVTAFMLLLTVATLYAAWRRQRRFRKPILGTRLAYSRSRL